MKTEDTLTAEQVQALEPGQRVAWEEGGSYGLGVVTRVTRTQIVITSDHYDHEVRAWRDGRNAGQIVGKSYHHLAAVNGQGVRRHLARELMHKVQRRTEKALTQPRKASSDGKYSYTVGWDLDSAREALELLRTEIGVELDRLAKIADGTAPELRATDATPTSGSW